MSKAADELAARAARTAARSSTTPAPAEVQPAPPAPAAPPATPRAEPVRITVDLAPITHRELLEVCREAAERLQVPKVPAASLLRALLAQLEDDPELVERLVPHLRADVEANRRRK